MMVCCLTSYGLLVRADASPIAACVLSEQIMKVFESKFASFTTRNIHIRILKSHNLLLLCSAFPWQNKRLN